MKLTSPASSLNRVGAVLTRRLKELGIYTVQDLLSYFPFRYEDYRGISPISQLRDNEMTTVKGKIEIIGARRSPRKRKLLTEAVINDGTEQLRVVWFGQPFIAKTLKAGGEVYLSGKIKADMLGMQMQNPSYEKVRTLSSADQETSHTARIVPIYHLTAGITQKQMRYLITQAIAVLKAVGVEDWLPEEVRKKAHVIAYQDALLSIHFPASEEARKEAERRLKFDELFVLQLRAEMIRQSIKRSESPQIQFKEKEIKEFVEKLPFALTKDQKIAAWEIFQDIEKSSPMNRLLEGDVGSGKTVVAAMIMYNAALNNFQSTIMAPTEILAVQHFESLTKVYDETMRIALLTGSTTLFSENLNVEATSKKAKRETLCELVKQGKIDVLVGTHALLSEDVSFKNLGIVIVDEQHRFGVAQRKGVREQSARQKYTPHFLSMTATPIPRSFALTIYGDLDISIIKQMPEGRKEIKTRLVDPHNRDKAYQFIREQIKEGRQAFVICPLIEDVSGDAAIASDKKSVLAEYKKLSEVIFPDLNVMYLHGKMKSAEKDEIMRGFAKGEIDILVSTSVVEVGVNIPNASVMMIEGAERFGLAQLHQFRGRVGRSSHQSYCFLFTDSDSEKAYERLGYFEKTTDGFALAEFDLHTRGPGEVYGTAQSGMMNFRLATMRDIDLIKLTRELSRDLDFSTHPELKQKVEEWEAKAHLE